MLYERLVKCKPALFLQASEFVKAAVEYFEWAEQHPLLEEKVFQYKGAIVRTDQTRMRPFTKQGLATFLGIPVSRFDSYKQRKDESWREAMELVEQVIYEQKFSGAAAGLLSSSIIGRDLGLADKTELSGPEGQPLESVVQYQLPSNGRDDPTPEVETKE